MHSYSMGTNAWRGEVRFSAKCGDFVLRPTFDAISKIELEAGHSLIVLAKELTENSLSWSQLCTIIYWASHAAGKEFSKDLCKKLEPDECLHVQDAVACFLGNVLEAFCIK